MPDLVQLTSDDGVSTLLLDRPDKRNALSIGLIDAMNGALDTLEADTDLRCLILGGTGKSFCAGMDLRGVLDDAKAMAGMLSGLARACMRLRRLPVPVIARAQGAAVGGGCGLVVVCDFAFTHADAKLGYPEVDLGVCPAVVAPWLVRKIGAGPARAMLLSGGTMSGQAALERGLVTDLVERDDLEAAAGKLARRLAKGGAEAIAVTKRWLNTIDGSDLDAEFERAAELSAEVIAGAEAQERLGRLFGT